MKMSSKKMKKVKKCLDYYELVANYQEYEAKLKLDEDFYTFRRKHPKLSGQNDVDVVKATYIIYLK